MARAADDLGVVTVAVTQSNALLVPPLFGAALFPVPRSPI
jgi:hypothetical protein